MSLSFFVRYLEKDTEFKIIFVGIEPETMDWEQNPQIRFKKLQMILLTYLRELYYEDFIYWFKII